MSREIEQLSRNLASGVSRRKALWQFAIGAAGLGFLAPKKASATRTNCFQELTYAYSDCITEFQMNPTDQALCAGAADPVACEEQFCLGIAFELYEACVSIR